MFLPCGEIFYPAERTVRAVTDQGNDPAANGSDTPINLYIIKAL